MKTVRNRIKELRESVGMKQSQLAEKISIRRETLSGIERGRQISTLYSALEIAEVFQMDVGDIFYLVDVPEEEMKGRRRR